MGDKLVKEAHDKMSKALENTKDRFASIRAGRASVSMLDGIMVNSYGVPSPLSQVGNVSAPEARMLTIDPWDKSLIKEIEKGISQANIGLNPNNDGKIIRIIIPELTADKRKDYVKLAKKDTEDGKIAVRNIRKDINNKLRKLKKDNDITEDELKEWEEKIQNITNDYIKKVDEAFSKKEKELIGK